MDYKTIMAEFDETINHGDVNIVETETYDDVSAKRKQFIGVSKLGKKWRARIQHPKLKVQVHLGSYSTPEEAALVVKNKKAEFEETLRTLKAEDGLCVSRKLPPGVGKQKSGKFRVQIWHPELKRCISFGSYSTSEEAAVVADRKRAELRELYKRKPRGCVDNDEVLQDCKSEAAAKFECLNEQTSDVIKDPPSNDRILLETYKIAVQMGSRTSNIALGTSNSSCVSGKMGQRKTSCSLAFDEAVSAGFINEYGQLVGKYREIDEQMWLGLPDENLTAP